MGYRPRGGKQPPNPPPPPKGQKEEPRPPMQTITVHGKEPRSSDELRLQDLRIEAIKLILANNMQKVFNETFLETVERFANYFLTGEMLSEGTFKKKRLEQTSQYENNDA